MKVTKKPSIILPEKKNILDKWARKLRKVLQIHSTGFERVVLAQEVEKREHYS